MTAINTILFVQRTFQPSDGWVVKYITVGCGIKIHHPMHGTKMCWVSGRGKRMRVVVKDAA